MALTLSLPDNPEQQRIIRETINHPQLQYDGYSPPEIHFGRTNFVAEMLTKLVDEKKIDFDQIFDALQKSYSKELARPHLIHLGWNRTACIIRDIIEGKPLPKN